MAHLEVVYYITSKKSENILTSVNVCNFIDLQDNIAHWRLSYLNYISLGVFTILDNYIGCSIYRKIIL